MTDNSEFYKETVFLPKTDFPMRGELPKREPEILKKWQDMDMYARLREQSQGRPKWLLHWGPPYANGHAHVGHAFTKSLKDVVNRSWQMMGYNAPLVPGWDCHGLPIEWKIEEKYRAEGKNKDEVDILTFRAECRAFAKEWVDIQGSEFQRLGVCGDFKNPYLTMTHDAEAGIVREIHKFLLNGALYRGVKPIMWSTVEKTALAEAEVEYKEHKSITVWAKFPVIKTNRPELEKASIVIWTTTPWTLPSNRAIAYSEHITYEVVEVVKPGENSKAKAGERLVIAHTLVHAVMEAAKIEEWKPVEQGALFGTELEGTIAAHPLRGQGYDFDVPLLAGDFVTEDTGTGFVHIAPGHGEDDYFLYMKHFGAKNIPDNVSDDGKMREHVPLFAGLSIYNEKGETGDANFAVLKAFDAAGALLHKGSLKHEYPHSWRSKSPLIFRTTPQWFIAMDDEDNNIRQKALKAISETRWVPKQGENRIRSMVEQRPDWCISRQRAWGVPIALFVSKATNETLKDEAVLDRIYQTFMKEGSDAWWKHDAQFFLGDGYKAEDYEQIFDIVDVWFESGSTHAFVLEQRPELKWPADLYLEGSDQHRGWFQSSLLESCGTRGVAPFKTVLTHGFVLDDKGYKMSKSLGNVVDPQDIMREHGADILRLWTMMSDFSEDVRIGKDTMKLTGDIYRRLRNTFRFLLGALDGFDAKEKVTDFGDMPELERLVLHWLAEMDGFVRDHVKNFEFGRLAHRLHNFCAGELSAFYFDIRKDRLYCDRPDSFERRACRTVLAHVFEHLCCWLAPMLCYTAEEAWSYRPQGISKIDSVHMTTFPEPYDSWKDNDLAERWNKIRDMRRVVLGALEPKRMDKTIGSSLEAAPVVYVTSEYKAALNMNSLAEIAITSQAAVETGEGPADAFRLDDVPGVAVVFKRAEGNRCARCWKVLPEVGTDKEYPDLSLRDADAVRWYQKNSKAA